MSKDARCCYAPGDKCFGCPHYWGNPEPCDYAPKWRQWLWRLKRKLFTGSGGDDADVS